MKSKSKQETVDEQQTSSHREERLVRHSGNARHRLNQNPLERQYAKVWREKQASGLLEYLMGDGATRGMVSDRDELVAATIIQWLGSPVGQSFLRDVNSLPNAIEHPTEEAK